MAGRGNDREAGRSSNRGQGVAPFEQLSRIPGRLALALEVVHAKGDDGDPDDKRQRHKDLRVALPWHAAGDSGHIQRTARQ